MMHSYFIPVVYKQSNKNKFPFGFGLIFRQLLNQSKWSLAHINNRVIATLKSWFESHSCFNAWMSIIQCYLSNVIIQCRFKNKCKEKYKLKK